MVNRAVRQGEAENKKRLAEYIAQQLNVVVNPKALFDVQIKRIHEYKRN
ncbi:glycogen/starch/alpha-glucan phosphorylase [Shigella flexneri]